MFDVSRRVQHRNLLLSKKIFLMGYINQCDASMLETLLISFQMSIYFSFYLIINCLQFVLS